MTSPQSLPERRRTDAQPRDDAADAERHPASLPLPGPAPQQLSWLRQAGGVGVVALLAVGGWLLFGQSDASNGAPGFPGPGRGGGGSPVVTEPVTMTDSTQTLRAIGTGESLRSVTLFPPDEGEVKLVLFTPGGEVALHDALLALDDAEQVLAVELAQLQVDEQQRAVARNEQLAPGGSVSVTTLQTSRTALAEARNRLATAQLALDRRTLLAPFPGIVGMTAISEGDRVTTTTPITTLDDRSALRIAFAVPERYAAQVALGQEVTATTPALPDATFRGTISAIDSRLDPALRTLAVEASVPNDDDQLRAGFSFAVALAFPATAHPSVPELAVQWSRDGAYVWRIADGNAQRVPIAVIERSAGRILVDAALAPGDRVVVEGTQRLRDGRPVEDVTAETEGGGAS